MARLLANYGETQWCVEWLLVPHLPPQASVATHELLMEMCKRFPTLGNVFLFNSVIFHFNDA
jgi:hypothetical protein